MGEEWRRGGVMRGEEGVKRVMNGGEWRRGGEEGE